jgi:hypothetical protein
MRDRTFSTGPAKPELHSPYNIHFINAGKALFAVKPNCYVEDLAHRCMEEFS